MDRINKIIKKAFPGHTAKDTEAVLRLLDEHPTFIAPALLLLKSGIELDAETRQRLQTHIMLNCPDRQALTDYIDPTDAGWAQFYPETPEIEHTTEETIDDFINTYATASTPEEDRLLERLLFNPVPVDYFAGTDEPYDPSDPLALPPELQRADSSDEAADEAVTVEATVEVSPDSPAADAVEAAGAQKVVDEGLLRESLAKIYIKQQRYERAFEIISKLSLNYPEKSVYFADQLRFLQKLMINQQAKNHKSVQ